MNSLLYFESLSKSCLAISGEILPFSLLAKLVRRIFAYGSFISYLSFSGSILEFLLNSYWRSSWLFSSLKSCLTDYLLTWWCLSIIWFSNSGLWFFSTPKVYFMKVGSIPFFLPIYSSFLRALSFTCLSSIFLLFESNSSGFFRLLSFLSFPYTLSIATKSGNYKFTRSYSSSSINLLFLSSSSLLLLSSSSYNLNFSNLCLSSSSY